MSLQEPPSHQPAVVGPGGAGDEPALFDLSPDGRALIAQAIRGEHEALRRLWNQHRRWVAAVLLAHMPRKGGPELDDLLQEVAVAVVGKISGLRDEAAFKPWLRAVAMSIARTSGRRTKVRKEGWLKIAGFTGRDRHDDEDEGGPSSARAQALAEGRRLMDLAAELPDGYREPLLLKCVQGMSYKQIGEVMGLPDTTIETRIARARKMLRERAEKTKTFATEDTENTEQGVRATRIPARAPHRRDPESADGSPSVPSVPSVVSESPR